MLEVLLYLRVEQSGFLRPEPGGSDEISNVTGPDNCFSILTKKYYDRIVFEYMKTQPERTELD